MIKHFVDFIYDEVESRRMGVLHASMDSSMYEEDFLPSREVITEKVRNRSDVYFKRLERGVRKFQMTFVIDGIITSERERMLKQWLDVEYYKPLQFVEDKEGRVIYCMPEGDTKITHTGMYGYVTVTMVSNSPFMYGNYKVLKLINDNNLENSPSFVINNRGDKKIPIEMWIKKTNFSGGIKITNLRNGDVMEIRQLDLNETVYIDGINKYIDTDNQFVVSRYDDFNKHWFEVDLGNNEFSVDGDCEINIRFREKFL